MKPTPRSLPWILSVAACALTVLGGQATPAEGAEYDVTLTNLTRGQVITPPVLIVHDRSFSLFTPGMPASPELTLLAEEGATSALEAALAGEPGVSSVAVGGGPLMPGESVTLRVHGGKGFPLLTAVGMLAVTNDAFFAGRGIRLPKRGHAMARAAAWDAGSEGNSESCDHVPGPPCGSANARNTGTAEGYVHVHAGIHGIADLDPAAHDWRNPVVGISVRRAL